MTNRILARLILLAATVTLGAFGCASSGDTQTAEPIPTDQQAQRTDQESERMDSGEILYVLQTINDAEISQAQLAMQRSQNPKVQQIAEALLQDHRALQQRIDQLADETGAELRESELSRSIADEASSVEEEISALSGEEFDQAFLRNQVAIHEIALETAREDLLPEAMDAQVVQLLTNTSQSLEEHLVMARQTYQEAQDSAIGGGPKEGQEEEMDEMDEIEEQDEMDEMDEIEEQDEMDEMDEMDQ